MIGIAVALLLIIIVFTIAVVVSNPTVFDLSIFEAAVPVTTGGVYLTGAAAMLVFVLAAALLRRGVQRDLARRRQVRALQRAAGVKSLPTPTRRPATVPSDAMSSEPATAASEPAHRSKPQEGPSTVAPRGDDRQTQHPTPAFRSRGKPKSGSVPIDPEQTKPEPTDPEQTDREPTNLEVAERQALLEEANELTGESSDR